MPVPGETQQARRIMPETATSPSTASRDGASPAAPGSCSWQAPIGILAGGGDVPRLVAQSIIKNGGDVHIVGLRGEASASIEEFDHSWCYWGAVGTMLRAFRQAGCRELVIVGRVRRPELAQIRPDLGFLRSLPAVLALMKGGDDSVLSKVVLFFEGQGFIVRGAHEFAPALLAGTGVMGRVMPSRQQNEAIARGAALLRALGPFDIGQAVLATPGGIVALEGAGGTDAMIRNAAISRTATPKDMVLVKLPKPGQELRVDMPTIGPVTIDLIEGRGVAGMAVAGGQTLVLQRESLIAKADAAGMFITGIDETRPDKPRPDRSTPGAPRPGGGSGREDGRWQATAGAMVPLAASGQLKPLGRRRPKAQDWSDIDMGRRLLAVLKNHAAGHSVVISRNYVLAVGGGEPLVCMLQLLGRGQPWGRILPRRRGVLLLRNVGANGYPEVNGEVLRWARKAWLAGIVFAEGPLALNGAWQSVADAAQDGAAASGPGADLLAGADDSGLFIVGARQRP